MTSLNLIDLDGTRFKMIYGEAFQMLRLYRHLEQCGVSTYFEAPPGVNSNRTYGIILFKGFNGKSCMSWCGNEVILGTLSAIINGKIATDGW